jgi:hypothetical protein
MIDSRPPEITKFDWAHAENRNTQLFSKSQQTKVLPYHNITTLTNKIILSNLNLSILMHLSKKI